MSHDGKLTNDEDLEQILNSFPQENVALTFGYGSGVFAQTSGAVSEDDLPMIDLIFASSNSKKWHEENLKRNANHYSLLSRTLGSDFINKVQQWGAGVYFNPMVTVDAVRKRSVKYGVIDELLLRKDLKEWDSIYISGRLQKPCLFLNTRQSDEILELQEEHNLKYALSTALLLLDTDNHQIESERVDMHHLFETIASLSYLGDPRMAAGAEDPLKVRNLVHSPGQYDRFYKLYQSQLFKMQKEGILSINEGNKSIQVNLLERSTRLFIHRQLPEKLSYNIKDLVHDISNANGQVPAKKIKLSGNIIKGQLSKIIATPAKFQSAKGLVTAGLVKSARYAYAKLKKGALKGIV